MKETIFYIPEKTIFFLELIVKRFDGIEISPYYNTMTRTWYINGQVTTLEKIGKNFDIDHSDLTMLRLKYD